MFKCPEKYRLTKGAFRTSEKDGNNGAFIVPVPDGHFQVIASDGDEWEHVSVTKFVKFTDTFIESQMLRTITPSWDEMCLIKGMFWEPGDLVVQYHPPASEYVNIHENVLHLWRKAGTNAFCEMPEHSKV